MRLISWNVNGRYGAALPEQIAAVADRRPDLVALQEVRAESADAWTDGLQRVGLDHVIDSSDLLARSAPAGRDYERRYFNLIAARRPLEALAGLDIAFPERYLAASVGAPDGE